MDPIASITFERGRGQPRPASQEDWPGELLGIEVAWDPIRSPRFVEAAKANPDLFPAFERRGTTMVRYFVVASLPRVLQLLSDVFGPAAPVRGPDDQVFEAGAQPPVQEAAPPPASEPPLRATDEPPDVLPRTENARRVGDALSDGRTDAVVTWVDPSRDSVRLDDGTFVSARAPQPTVGRRGAEAIAARLVEAAAEEGHQAEVVIRPSAVAARTERVLAAVTQLPVLPFDQQGPVSAVGLPTDILSDRPLPEGLSDYQQEGARWMDARQRAILADEMGLGKTVTTSAVIDAPAVIVCPKTLKTNWRRELARWRPDLTVLIVEGASPPPERARSADVVIINYDILGSHADWILHRPNATLIADEAHMLKNLALRPSRENRDVLQATGGSNRARIFFEMAMRTPRLFFLSGTPFENRPSEMFPMLHMVEPRVFMDQIRFRARYESGYRNAELFARINYTFMLRRRKDVLPNFPEKVRRTMVVSLSDEVRPVYQRAANDFLRWVAQTGGAEAAMRAQRAAALTRLNALRKWSALGKVEAAMEFIVDFFESTRRPLVIMAHHSEVFTALDTALRELNEAVRMGRGGDRNLPSRPLRYAIVTGKTPGAARDRAKDAFQDGQLDIIVWAIELATGVTLTRSNDMLFMERVWVPSKLVQAEDRIHRRGQRNNCTITYLDAEGTVDRYMALLLAEKTRTFAGVIDGRNLSEAEAFTEVVGMMFGSEMQRNPPGSSDAIVELDGDLRAAWGSWDQPL